MELDSQALSGMRAPKKAPYDWDKLAVQIENVNKLIEAEISKEAYVRNAISNDWTHLDAPANDMSSVITDSSQEFLFDEFENNSQSE